ncbi:MAG: inner-rane translocator [Marmoricola sp.]|nr:inner-rane translocator [Marmoricola sp.]
MSVTSRVPRKLHTARVVPQRAGANRLIAVVGLLRDYAVVVTGVLIFIVLSITQPVFFSSSNLENIVNQNAPLAIIAVGTTIAIIMRGWDLSLGSIYAFSGVTAAWLANHSTPFIGLIGGVLSGVLIGLINGVLVSRLRINSFLATLASGMIVLALGNLYSGGFVITVAAPSFQTLGTGTVLGIQDATWLMIIFAVIVGLILARSRFGRYSYAIGGSPTASRLSGVRLALIETAAFALSGFGAAAAGVIAASQVSQGSSDVGSDLTLRAIAAVVVGGTSIAGGSGAIWRSVCGVLLLGMLANGINLFGVNPLWSDIITGGVILVAVGLQGIGRRT